MNDNKFEIIDFHTHPFDERKNNICQHIDNCDMSAENTVRDLKGIGYSAICGSVIAFGGLPKDCTFDDVKAFNDEALRLRDLYKGFYIPGFHINPRFVDESCAEIDRMHKLGVNLIGEIVPSLTEWGELNYASPELGEILEYSTKYDMIVSFHSTNHPAIHQMVTSHPNVRFVGAHPGEYGEFMTHMEHMKACDNYYVDVSANGIVRHGMLRHGIDLFGAERFLYGSDYPTCNPAMFLAGVRDDFSLTDKEKELILGQNAKNLLGLR